MIGGLLAALLALVVVVTGCVDPRYLGQAAHGQLQLLQRARPIDRVIDDPNVDERTAMLLSESLLIKEYAREQGLSVANRYTRFVELDDDAVVWFVSAAEPLALEPVTFTFPIVGAFPNLSYFEREDALAFYRRMRGRGYDVYIRGVSAYSTGGWFPDPVLSSMFSPEDDAFASLANILIHELVHATIFIPSQTYFNESIASFVGDGMAADYLAARFGAQSPELLQYQEDLAGDRSRGARLTAAYTELAAVYASSTTDEAKLARKRSILAALRRELDLVSEPNNASLLVYKVYNAGFEELATLFEACDSSWPRFLGALATLGENDFDSELEEHFGRVILELVAARCPMQKKS